MAFQRRRMTAEEAEYATARIRELAAKGLPDTEIAWHIQRAASTVGELRRAAGIPGGKTSPRRKAVREPKPADPRRQNIVTPARAVELRPEVERLAKEGKTDRQAGEVLGLKRDQVEGIRQKFGIPAGHPGPRGAKAPGHSSFCPVCWTQVEVSGKRIEEHGNLVPPLPAVRAMGRTPVWISVPCPGAGAKPVYITPAEARQRQLHLQRREAAA